MDTIGTYQQTATNSFAISETRRDSGLVLFKTDELLIQANRVWLDLIPQRCLELGAVNDDSWFAKLCLDRLRREQKQGFSARRVEAGQGGFR
jgi:hypothetical protein